MRLLQWEALAGASAADEANRTAVYQRKVLPIAATHQAGLIDDEIDRAYLVFHLPSLAGSWFSVPHLAPPAPARRPDSRRLC
jgi:hypothetical protein